MIFVFLVFLLVLMASFFNSDEKTGGNWLTKYNWFESKPLITLDDLKEFEGFKYPVNVTNCHLGQRKLLLNEIEFYTKYDPKTIIYSGSAHGEHTPVILEMFPNCTLIMIDPNYHIMDYDYMYIYKRGFGNKKDILKLAKKDRDRGQHLKALINSLKDKKCIDGTSHNVLDEEDFGNESNIELIKDSKCRVFVIQDYMTRHLAKLLKPLLTKDSVYISDIRTIFLKDFGDHPSALDILHNSALQLNIFHELEIPCHLKFVLPAFRKADTSMKKEIPDFIKDEITYSKKYGIDFLSDYENGKFKYYDGEIYLQPWSRALSRETRLVITKPVIKEYNRDSYMMKFSYFNYMRQNAFVKENELVGDYDGCLDCALEQVIIKKYIKKFKTGKDLLYYNDLISKYTFWKLNSTKCSKHGRLMKPKDKVTFYFEEDYELKHISVPNM